MLSLFTIGSHHQRMVVFLLAHNLYSGRLFRQIVRQCSLLTIFANFRLVQPLRTLGSQVGMKCVRALHIL